MQDKTELTNVTSQHISIKKRHLFLGGGSLILLIICLLVILFFPETLQRLKNEKVKYSSPEMLAKFKELENSLNSRIQQVNEIFLLKENLDRQTPQGNGNGKGGPYHPLELIHLDPNSASDMEQSLLTINQSIQELDALVPTLKTQINQSLIPLSKLSEGVPIAGKYVITSEFGARLDPFQNTSATHTGIDFSAPIGTPVLAAATGIASKVVEADPGYGNYVEILHNKGWVTKYAHLNQVLIKQNQMVNKGDLIGTVGNTGRSTGSHLHFELLSEGVPIDPSNTSSPFPVKVATNRVNNNIYSASVREKCANLKLITLDENSTLMKACLKSGGKNANEVLLAHRANESLKKQPAQKNGFSNHCYSVDQENRLIIGNQSACNAN